MPCSISRRCERLQPGKWYYRTVDLPGYCATNPLVMTINPTAKAAPRLVYLVTEDWYFLSHRLPMARAAQEAGYDVHVLTNVTGHERAIAALGFRVHPVEWRRGSMNPLGLLTMVRAIRRLYRALAPDLVHHVALQPTVVGSLAATGLPMACLNAVTGWGFAFVSPKARARIARRALEWLLPRLLNRPRAAALVQNTDDRAALAGLGVACGSHLPHPRVRGRCRRAAAAARAGRGRDGGLRRPPARQQGAAHAGRRP